MLGPPGHPWKKVAHHGALCALAGLSCSLSGGQTYTVQGSQISVKLVLNKDHIVLGEPLFISLVVRNESNKAVRLIVGDEARIVGLRGLLRYYARRDDGLEVWPPPPPSAVAGNAMVGPRDLPPHGAHQYEGLLADYLPINEPGTYTIRCQKLLVFPRQDAGDFLDRRGSEQVDAEASTRLTILPPDPKALGQVIDKLGREMAQDCEENYAKLEAAHRSGTLLLQIQDERVIPWFLKLVARRDSYSRQQAAAGLAKFNRRDAFSGVRRMLETRAQDLDVEQRWAANEVEQVRLTVAFALAKCPYAGAVPLLYSLCHDPSESIRLQVVHAAGARSDRQSTAILREMSRDPAKWVSDEAKRYLGLRETPKPTEADP